jgi:transposase
MGKPRVNVSKAQFIELYVNQKKSGVDVARFFGIGRTTVSRYLKEWNIKERTLSEVLADNPRAPWTEERRVEAAERLRGKLGALSRSWKGGGAWTDEKGYRRIRHNGRSVLEHRVIMEQDLGRKLRENEDVHHINGDKADNRVENLLVILRSQHSKLHWNQDEAAKKRAQSNFSKQLYAEGITFPDQDR